MRYHVCGLGQDRAHVQGGHSGAFGVCPHCGLTRTPPGWADFGIVPTNKIPPVRRLVLFSPKCLLLLAWQASPTGKVRSDAVNHVVALTPNRLRAFQIPKALLVRSAAAVTPPYAKKRGIGGNSDVQDRLWCGKFSLKKSRLSWGSDPSAAVHPTGVPVTSQQYARHCVTLSASHYRDRPKSVVVVMREEELSTV